VKLGITAQHWRGEKAGLYGPVNTYHVRNARWFILLMNSYQEYISSEQPLTSIEGGREGRECLFFDNSKIMGEAKLAGHLPVRISPAVSRGKVVSKGNRHRQRKKVLKTRRIASGVRPSKDSTRKRG